MAENLLRSNDTVEQFNARLRMSVRPDGDGRKAWAPEQYTRAKNAIASDGPGLGKDVVKHFMPTGSAPKNDTIQAILDSYYAERRERAARKHLEEVEQELAHARAANDDLKTKAAKRKAQPAQAKLDHTTYAGIKRELLEKLDSNAKMNDAVKLIKQEKIPPQYHEELIEQAIGWAADSPSSRQTGASIMIKGSTWWG